MGAGHREGRLDVDEHSERRQLWTKKGAYKIVKDLEIDDFSRARIDASVHELADERAAVMELGLI